MRGESDISNWDAHSLVGAFCVAGFASLSSPAGGAVASPNSVVIAAVPTDFFGGGGALAPPARGGGGGLDILLARQRRLLSSSASAAAAGVYIVRFFANAKAPTSTFVCYFKFSSFGFFVVDGEPADLEVIAVVNF